ncbi:MAG: hypothetical protein ACC682_02670 [Gemmatimonadota bacterium]
MRIRAPIGTIVLGALLATTPQLAVGQRKDDESLAEITCRACRPGTEMQSDQLGEFLAKNVNVRFGTDMRPLSVELRVEMVSRDEGVIGKWESEAVEVRGGETYSASTWVSQRDRREGMVPYKGGGSVKYIITDFLNDRECEGATHAVWITLMSDDEQKFSGASGVGKTMVCLTRSRRSPPTDARPTTMTVDATAHSAEVTRPVRRQRRM